MTLLRAALFPDPGTAHDWLHRELSRREYQESLPERFSRWFNNLLHTITSSAAGGLNPVAGLTLLALVAAGIAFALSRLRTNPDSGTPGVAVFSELRETAEEHRRRSHTALLGELWGEAVIESVRALAVGLFERGLMPEQSGVTVHEIAQRASVLFPDFHERLEKVTIVFDRTLYGERPATEQRARDAVALELELSSRSPTGDGSRGAVSAVPR